MRYHWWISFSPKNLGSAQPKSSFSDGFLVCVMAAALAVPAVERIVGVDARYSVPTVLTYAVWVVLSQRLLAARALTTPWAFHTMNAGDVLLGQAIVVALPIASGDPTSPLWALAVLFAGMNGADYDYGGNFAMLALHVLTPLLGVPFYLAGGTELGPAIGGPLFFAACSFLAYHFNATRTFEVRTALEERDQLQRKLDEERAQRERERIARDLHDSVGASLSTAALYADVLASAPNDSDEIRRIAEALSVAAREGLGELRSLLDALSPDDVDARSFCDALRAHGERLAAAASLSLEVELDGGTEVILPSALRFALARVFQEGLHNAVRHAGAARVRVTLSVTQERSRLVLEDDGCGFDPAAERAGRGVRGMRARVTELGGRFEIGSAGERGTRVVVELPASLSLAA